MRPFCLVDPEHSFDPASLTILQRLDDLEELLRAKNTHPLVLEQPASQDSPPLSIPIQIPKTQGPPSLQRSTDWRPSYINIEAVLAWPIFEDQNFDGGLDLRSLLRFDKDHVATPPAMSISADFDLHASGQLLQQFLDHVHIFNPVLEEKKVREYMRVTSFNGLAWDAESCLLVIETTESNPASQLISHS